MMHRILPFLILLRVTIAQQRCFAPGPDKICQGPMYQFTFTTDCAANANVKFSATESLDLLTLRYICYDGSTEEHVVLEDYDYTEVVYDWDGSKLNQIISLPVSEASYCVFSACGYDTIVHCRYVIENLFTCSWPANTTTEVSSVSTHVPTPSSVLLSLSTTLPFTSAIPVVTTINDVAADVVETVGRGESSNSHAPTLVVVLAVMFGTIALVAVIFITLVLLAVGYSKRKESASSVIFTHTTGNNQESAKKVFLGDELSLAPSVMTVYSTGYFYAYRNTTDIMESKKDLSHSLQGDHASICTDIAENLPCYKSDDSGYVQRKDSVTSLQSQDSCSTCQTRWEGQSRDGQVMAMTATKQPTALNTNAHTTIRAINPGSLSANDGYVTSTMLNLPNDGYVSSNIAMTVAQQPITLESNAHLPIHVHSTNAGMLSPDDGCTTSTMLNSPNDGYISSDMTVTAVQQPITLDTNACTSMHATNPGLLSPDDGHTTTVVLNSLNSEYVDSDMSVMTASKEDGSGYRESDVILSLTASEYQPALLSSMLGMQPSLSELSLDVDLQKQPWEGVREERTINPPSEDGYVSSKLFVSMASSYDGSGYKQNHLIFPPGMSELQPSLVADLSCTKASPSGVEPEVDLLMQDWEMNAEERTPNPLSGYLEDSQTSLQPTGYLQDNYTSLPSSRRLEVKHTSLPSSGYLDNHTSLASSGYLQDNHTSLTSGQPHISEGDLDNVCLPVDAVFGTGTFGLQNSTNITTGSSVAIVQYPNPAEPKQDSDGYIHASLELLPSVKKSIGDLDPFYETDVSGEEPYSNEEENKSDVPECPTTNNCESGTESSPMVSNDYVQWDVSNKQVPLSVSQPIHQISLSEASHCSGYVKAPDFFNSPHNQNLQPIRPIIDDYIYT